MATRDKRLTRLLHFFALTACLIRCAAKQAASGTQSNAPNRKLAIDDAVAFESVGGKLWANGVAFQLKGVVWRGAEGPRDLPMGLVGPHMGKDSSVAKRHVQMLGQLFNFTRPRLVAKRIFKVPPRISRRHAMSNARKPVTAGAGPQ